MPDGVMNDAVQTTRRVRKPFRPFRLESAKYRAVFAAKRSFYGRTLVLWVACLPDAGRKAGVVVSKRALPLAVERNRAKRLMREAFRLNRDALCEEVDILLVARSGIKGKTYQEVALDFERVCQRAKIWRRKVCDASSPA